MPVENFNVRKTTEHTGVRTQQLVLSDLPKYQVSGETEDFAILAMEKSSGIIHEVVPPPKMSLNISFSTTNKNNGHETT